MNVDAYLDRICYYGSREPNLENLRALSYAQKINIQYTSSNFFGGARSTLDVKKMYDKIVTEKGGGICYELNYLFLWLLQQLGYDIEFCPAEFFHEFFEGFSPSHHHMIPLVTVENIKYLVDPGWFTFGPMKFEHMLPHIETHAIYRMRKMSSRDGWYYMERHKKTVLDAQGNILKKGPATSSTGYCDDECAKEESDHWTFMFRFDTTPAKVEDFQYRLDYLHDDEQSILYDNFAMIRFTPNKFLMFFGDSYAIKESVDPNTDKILEEVKLKTDDDLVRVAKEIFNCEINHKLSYFSCKKQ